MVITVITFARQTRPTTTAGKSIDARLPGHAHLGPWSHPDGRVPVPDQMKKKNSHLVQWPNDWCLTGQMEQK